MENAFGNSVRMGGPENISKDQDNESIENASINSDKSFNVDKNNNLNLDDVRGNDYDSVNSSLGKQALGEIINGESSEQDTEPFGQPSQSSNVTPNDRESDVQKVEGFIDAIEKGENIADIYNEARQASIDEAKAFSGGGMSS